MGKLQVVVGGQFGSEGKGAVAAWLADPRNRGGTLIEEDGVIVGAQQAQLAAVRVAGPNAGHTAYDAGGRKWALQQIPVAVVRNPDCQAVIAAGSEIDPLILQREYSDLFGAGLMRSGQLVVDAQATIIDPGHGEQETDGLAHGSGGLTARIGSTGKGVGAARAARIMREAKLWGVDASYTNGESTDSWYPDTARGLHDWIAADKDALVEGTQGYGLGLHAGYYPYCTSSDCRAIDMLAMAGISPWQQPWGRRGLEIWVVMRSFPIRVAGNSGPMRKEITWEDLERRTEGHVRADKAERTTVTHKVRRIGEWDPTLAAAAARANGASDRYGGGVRVAMMFLDYVFPETYGQTDPDCLGVYEAAWLVQREKEIGAPIELVGTGPQTMIDLRSQDLQAALRHAAERLIQSEVEA